MFTLSFATDSAAFEDEGPASETARILRQIATQLEEGSPEGGAFDLNGNRIGSYGLTDPEAPPESVSAFAKRYGLRMEAQQIPARPDRAPGFGYDARHWVCTFKRGAFPAVAFLFSQGSAHTRPPQLDEVLDCLASDAASYLNARDADEMADEMGCESPKEAARLWDSLRQTVEKLELMLGRRADVEALAFKTERL